MDKLEFVRLGVDDNRDIDFDCGNEDLNEFFFEDSKGNCRELMAVTYAWRLHGKTISFFSVSNDSITKQDVENYNKFRKILPWRKRYKTMPSVKIGRFAVHKDFKGYGYGSSIMDFIKIWFVSLNKTGCRFIIVDALKEAVPFYEKNGFLPLGGDKENDSTQLMFFDLVKVAKHTE
jgi:GNAT superfamily N-acetyltransferase